MQDKTYDGDGSRDITTVPISYHPNASIAEFKEVRDFMLKRPKVVKLALGIKQSSRPKVLKWKKQSRRSQNENDSGSLKRSSDMNAINEPTLKKLQSAEPDLTIVVGGEEFHHYKQILCQACPFIDKALANKMKESSTASRLVFPDRKPNVWRLVYLMLDPFVNGKEKDGLIESLSKSLLDSFKNKEQAFSFPFASELLELLSFLDYLGMESLVKQYDKQMAKLLADYLTDNHLLYSGDHHKYSSWLACKSYPCPLTLKVVKERYKVEMLQVTYELSRKRKSSSWKAHRVETMVEFLLDKQCGEEMWQHLLSHMYFPYDVVHIVGRESFVPDQYFKYVLEMAGRSIGEPVNFECPTELES